MKPIIKRKFKISNEKEEKYSGTFIGTEEEWEIWMDNMKGLWGYGIDETKDEEVTEEDKKWYKENYGNDPAEIDFPM